MSRVRAWLRLPMRLDQLAAALQHKLRAAGAGDWAYDAEQQVLRSPDQTMMNLGNAHREYACAARADRAVILQKFVTQAQLIKQQEMPQLWTLASNRLYPVVRCRSDASFHALYVRLEGSPPPQAPQFSLAADLCIRVVCDFEGSLMHVGDEHLDTWGQDAEAALEAAMANLRALPRPEWETRDGGFFQIAGAPGYQLSYLLSDKARALLPFAASAVYMACSRGILLAADGTDEQACLAMLAHAERCHAEQPWPMSGAVVGLGSEGCWELARLPGAADLAAGNRMTVRTAEEYEEQKNLLEKLYERENRDVFLPACSVMAHDRDGGRYRSWCTWVIGVHTELPRTDLLVAAWSEQELPENDLYWLKWSDMADVCADLLHPLDLEPIRYEVHGAPTEAQWEELRRRAVERVPRRKQAEPA